MIFPGFKIGDMVTWTSQAGGSNKTKTGKVVSIVPAGVLLQDVIGFNFCKRKGLYTLSQRDHESYVVEVGTKLYQPRVAALSRAVKVDSSPFLVPALDRARNGRGNGEDARIIAAEIDRLNAETRRAS